MHRKFVKGVNPESSLTRRNGFPFFLPFLFVDLYEKMGVSWTHGGNHLTVPVEQTIMLYALDFHCDVCQVFLSTTGQKIPHKYGALVKD